MPRWQSSLVDRVPDASTSQPQPPSLNPTDSVAALCRHRHETDLEQLILRLCRELLAECPTEVGPTPLRVLGSCQGVRSYRSRPIRPEAGCSGLLIPSDGGYEITVNSSEPQERQNFSTAHEIVHTFFRDAAVSTVAMTSQRPDRSGWLGQS